MDLFSAGEYGGVWIVALVGMGTRSAPMVAATGMHLASPLGPQPASFAGRSWLAPSPYFPKPLKIPRTAAGRSAGNTTSLLLGEAARPFMASMYFSPRI